MKKNIINLEESLAKDLEKADLLNKKLMRKRLEPVFEIGRSLGLTDEDMEFLFGLKMK